MITLVCTYYLYSDYTYMYQSYSGKTPIDFRVRRLTVKVTGWGSIHLPKTCFHLVIPVQISYVQALPIYNSLLGEHPLLIFKIKG